MLRAIKLATKALPEIDPQVAIAPAGAGSQLRQGWRVTANAGTDGATALRYTEPTDHPRNGAVIS
jgi:hypothetical protein